QKEMEAALRASEAKYRALMEGASDGILVTDSEGRLLDSNRRVQDLLGYTPEELKGLAAADIYPGGELREVLSMFSRILRSGPAVRQSWLLRKDGVCVPVEMAANTIEYHGVRVVQSIFRDLRERRESELQTAKLSSAVEQTADAVMITDRNGTIEYVNPAFQAITGYTAEGVVGNTPRLLRSGRMDRQFYARLWSTILSGRTFRATFINRRKNGSLYHEDKTVTPIRDPLGQVSHFVSSSRDVTEKVAAERMRREEEKAHRDALVREVHHRIKNHLQGLVGLLRQEITRSAEHGAPLEKVIGQIHSMSVVHGLQSASGHGEIRLCEMLTAICRSAEQVMGLTVELDLALEMERPLRVAPDEAVSVALVLNELLVNAAKYGSPGEPVRVRLRGAAAKGEVKIINMAPGLPETFDFAAGCGLGTGLALVRVLLPGRGAVLDIHWNEGVVEACLGLDAPVLVPP
ncbi:MAG TPA: PAS domain S-box protein, partial [Gammaproteobacteria bacterium]|nr:PAS domain S-box protein [Gammaproteobacteria bacterium]